MLLFKCQSCLDRKVLCDVIALCRPENIYWQAAAKPIVNHDNDGSLTSLKILLHHYGALLTVASMTVRKHHYHQQHLRSQECSVPASMFVAGEKANYTERSVNSAPIDRYSFIKAHTRGGQEEGLMTMRKQFLNR